MDVLGRPGSVPGEAVVVSAVHVGFQSEFSQGRALAFHHVTSKDVWAPGREPPHKRAVRLTGVGRRGRLPPPTVGAVSGAMVVSGACENQKKK